MFYSLFLSPLFLPSHMFVCMFFHLQLFFLVSLTIICSFFNLYLFSLCNYLFVHQFFPYSLFLMVSSGSALQWPLCFGEPPRRGCLEPLHVSARVQLPGQPAACGVQAFPLPGHWSHPCHRPEKALWLPGRIQCQGSQSSSVNNMAYNSVYAVYMHLKAHPHYCPFPLKVVVDSFVQRPMLFNETVSFFR